MARVANLEPVTMRSNSVHDPVDATHTAFQDGDGNWYLQLDTYGSKSRKISGKKSQSLQFDKDAAKALYDLLQTTFKF